MVTPYSPVAEEGMRRLFDSLSERERRLFAGVQALQMGRGGLVYLSQLFDCDKKTIRRGIRELQEELLLSPGRSRKKGVVGNRA
jgi:hypothetical protein